VESERRRPRRDIQRHSHLPSCYASSGGLLAKKIYGVTTLCRGVIMPCRGATTLRRDVTTLCRGVTTLCRGVTTLCRGVTTLCRDVTTLCRGVTTLCHGVTTLCRGVTTLCRGATTLRHGVTTLCRGVTTLCRGVTTLCHGVTKIRRKVSTGTPTSSSALAPHSDDTEETPRNPVRQNARPILALAGFKCAISVIKYQEFMPDPSDGVQDACRFVELIGDFVPVGFLEELVS